MTLEQLRYFIAVTEYMNFTKAADRSFISQSSLSRHIADMESSLGIKLLIRDKSGISMTEAGEILRREGNHILDEIFLLEERIRLLSSGKTGNIRLLSGDFYSQELTEACRGFQKAYPDVNLSFDVCESSRVIEGIKSNNADIGVTFSYTLEGENEIECLPLKRERFCVLVPEDYRLSDRSSVSIAEIPADDFIAYGDSVYRYDAVSRLYSLLRVNSGSVSSATSPEHHIIVPFITAVMEVRVGRGVILAPRPIAGNNHSGCRILELTDPEAEFDVSAVWRTGHPNPVLSLFTEYVRNYTK